MLFDRIVEAFPESNIKKDEPLSYYSYTRTGGPADILIFPESIDEIVAIIKWINQSPEYQAGDLPLTILGNASNLIVKDGGIRGITIITTGIKTICHEENRITAGAGAAIIDVSQAALDHSLTGLEFACGIPGSTGGAVYMNAGAYGGEVQHCVESVQVLTRHGQLKTYSNAEMNFSYRHSYLMEEDDIVVSVTFKLESGDYATIREKMDELTYLRESKQPLEYPSCGSVFKRPEGHFTGKLIQEAGLQGLVHGGAQVSEKHAGFIINIGNATASDYQELIQHIQEEVYRIYKVKLEREVRIIGED